MSDPVSTLDDPELLRSYTEAGAEKAFAEIVRRHVNMVYSTALRRVNGDAALAEDVAQSVFADLARKARSLPRETVLGGWLHRHTGFTASKAVDKERRRRNREKEAAAMNALPCPSADPLWSSIAPILDDALDRLAPPDRDALVLRFFEKRDLRSVGEALGVSDDTAQKRISRALEKLRHFFSRRGVTSTAGALSTVLAGQAVVAAPAPFAAALPGSALAAAATTTGIMPALAALDVATRFKLAAAATALAACCATLIVVQHRHLARLRDEVRRLESRPVTTVMTPVAPPAIAPATPPAPPTAAPESLDDIVNAAARDVSGGRETITATTAALDKLSRIPTDRIPEALTVVSRVGDSAAQALLYRYLLGRWAEVDPWKALSYSQKELPMACRTGVYEGILTAWAGRNPESAFAWFQKSGGSAPPPVRESLLATLFHGLASQNLEKSFPNLTWLKSEGERGQALRGIIQTIVTSEDRERALHAIAGLDDVDARVQARRALVEHWASQDAPAAAVWVAGVSPAWERTRLMDSLGLTWLQSDPHKAADWWVAEAPGSETLVKIMNVWAHNDPNAAGAWLGRQARGAESDVARLTFARQIAETDAVSALAWADTVTDPALRESTIDHVFRTWHEREPAAAAAHLEKSGWAPERRLRIENLIR